MIDKKIFYCFIIVLLSFLSGCARSEKKIGKTDSLNKIQLAGQTIKVEIADTPETRYRGLSGRLSLPENQGMLFIFYEYAIPSFIMREMLFPLDIVWIKDNIVINCAKNLPIPKTGEPPVVVSPDEPINYVLEINAGWCQKNNIKYGELFYMD